MDPLTEGFARGLVLGVVLGFLLGRVRRSRLRAPFSLRSYRLGLALLALALLPALATAQSPACSFNPYIQQAFDARCSLNPYEVGPDGKPLRVCASDSLLSTPGVKLAIGEGEVGKHGKELGFVILTNPTTEPQDMVVELMLRGVSDTTFVRRVRLDGLTSISVGLHTDPLFKCTGGAGRIFNTFVYAESSATAELKIYAYSIGQPDPLSTVVLDKDGYEVRSVR